MKSRFHNGKSVNNICYIWQDVLGIIQFFFQDIAIVYTVVLYVLGHNAQI